MRGRLFVAVLAMAATGGAHAGSASAPDDLLARYADPSAFVVAVKTAFPAAGGQVHALAYESDKTFLERASIKLQATVDENGVAVLAFRGLRPGPYAFVVYYDANGDGRLNRGGVLGKPKEPIAFSNGVKPKLRRPHFDEAKVDVAPGEVIALTLEE